MHIDFGTVKRSLVGFAVAFAACAALSTDAYPARPVTLVVPWPAGGIVDHLGRAVAASLAKQLKQNVVVENKGGAAGTLGAGQVLRAPADGYTLLVGSPTEQINAPALMQKPPFDAATAFMPAGCIARGANVLVVNPKLPASSVSELISLAKAKPGALNYASSGNGNTTHLSAELFAITAGVDMTHVPYKGNAPAITDTIGGQVHMAFSAPGTVLPHIQSGALRALAVTATSRLAALPSTPTLKESGVPVEIYTWLCLFARHQTPERVMEQLQTALGEAVKDADFQKAVEAAGWERFPIGRQASTRFISQERKVWTDLIKARNIKAD